MGAFYFAAVCLGSGIFSLLASIIWFKKKNIIESAVIGLIGFFCSYIVCSMGLFVIDKFTIFRAAALSLILNFVLLGSAVFIRRDKKKFSIQGLFKCDFSLKNMLIPIIVCLMAFPFVMVKNELFGMGQDQGGYTIQAINFMYYDNARQKDFDEYYLLDTEEEREIFEYEVKNSLRGYDIPSEDYPDTVYDRDVSPVSGILHGIPTYAAVLAMWGTIFGMENMLTVETVFYMCLIFLVYFICRNLKLKNISRIAACAAAAAAPVVIWTAKASLTEIFLSILPSLFLYFMTDDENPKQKWMSIIAVAVFGCYHVSIYTVIPIFFIIYGGMYFFTREKQYAVLMPVTAAGYLASYFMMRQVQPFYTMNNYSPVFVGGINVNNISIVVTAACIAMLIFSAVYILILSRKSRREFSPSALIKKASDSRIFKIFLSMLIVLPVLFIAAKAVGKYNSLHEASYLAIWGFICNAGIVMVPIAIIAAALFPKFFTGSVSRLTVFLMFFYCILVYSAVLRYDIQYYYYYSRYLAPFIPIAVVFSVMTLDRCGGKLIIPAAAIGLVFNAPFDRFLMLSKDDTRMEWSVLEDVAGTVQAGDCVLIERQYMAHLWLPLKVMTEADIYPQADDIEDQFLNMSKKYERVLYISGVEESEDDYSIMYRNTINHSEDSLTNIDKIVPMSMGFTKLLDDIYVYRFDKYQFIYTAAVDYDKFSGVSANEGEFCWINDEEFEVECGLYPADYEMTISLGSEIPLSQLNVDELEVSVYINGKKAGKTAVTAENNGGSISLDIDKETVIDGINIIRIESELWDIADINPNDDRSVSIPLRSIVFTAAE